MLKTFLFTWFWAAGWDPGRKNWHLKYIDGPNMAPIYLPRGLNMGQHRPNIGQHGPNIGPTWAQALNIGPASFRTGNHCALCLPQFNIAVPGFVRRISAHSSHTISQKSLLGRRPAVRRKLLNPGAGQSPCSRTTEVPVIYGVFCCLGPFGGKGFHLGDVTKLRFLRGFGLQEGSQGGKIGILRSFQHRWPKHGPSIAPKMAQHGPT